MKDEINEILDNLAFTNDNYMWCDKTTLDTKQSHLLLDYITNLQEQLHKASLDIQELTERDLMCPTSCDKLTNLQGENERLKELYKRTCRHLFNIGNDELARYFQAQISECNVFTTQGKSDE